MSALTAEDVEFLERKGYEYEIREEVHPNGNKHYGVVFKQFALPAAYSPNSVELLIRLPPNYPETNPDMFFTNPWVKRAGTTSDPTRSSGRVNWFGREWQQWSRHYPARSWRPMIDGLETYMAAVHTELAKGI